MIAPSIGSPSDRVKGTDMKENMDGLNEGWVSHQLIRKQFQKNNQIILIHVESIPRGSYYNYYSYNIDEYFLFVCLLVFTYLFALPEFRTSATPTDL